MNAKKELVVSCGYTVVAFFGNRTDTCAVRDLSNPFVHSRHFLGTLRKQSLSTFNHQRSWRRASQPSSILSRKTRKVNGADESFFSSRGPSVIAVIRADMP